MKFHLFAQQFYFAPFSPAWYSFGKHKRNIMQSKISAPAAGAEAEKSG
jgi:hypothetical protein